MRKNRVVEQNRCYHLVSRLAHRAFFLDDEEKNRAVVLIRPRAAATPGPIKIRAETVRHGKYAPSAGELVFTPGSLKVSVSSAASGRRNAGLEKVESEQHEFEMK